MGAAREGRSLDHPTAPRATRASLDQLLRLDLEPPHAIHVLPPEVLLCGERVVRPTAEFEIFGRVLTSECVRFPMVNFEPRRFTASHAPRIHVGATRAVAGPDSSLHRS